MPNYVVWDEVTVDIEDGAPLGKLDGRVVRAPRRFSVDKHWAYLQGYSDGVIAERKRERSRP